MTIYGHFNSSDSDSRTIAQIGERVVWEAVQLELDGYNRDLEAFLNVFVEETTAEHQIKYMLAGGGYLQARSGQAQSAAVRGGSSWTIQLPLEEWGAQLAYDRVAWAYMTPKALQTHIDTVIKQDKATIKRALKRALLIKDARPFKCEIKGDLTVQPLANGDAVEYPPEIGSEVPSTANHYFTSGYAASAIDDTNNPVAQLVDKISRIGSEDDELVVFTPRAHSAKLKALADFIPVLDRHMNPGANRDTVDGAPSGLPGRVIGRTDNAWIVEWATMPTNYMKIINLNEPRPLIQRVDPENTNLGRGLLLISDDANTPFKASHYSHRGGFGSGNRLNGAVVELTADVTYDNPSGIII